MPDQLLSYTLTPQARISAGRAGEVVNYRSAHDLIPGAVVRGALGGTWINDPTFGYPGSADEARRSWLAGVVPFLEVRQAVPVTQMWPRLEHFSLICCKFRRPDCEYPKSADGTHSPVWFDVAHDTARAVHHCYGGVVHGRGWNWVGADSLLIDATRSALQRGVPSTGKLFTRQALRRDLTLHGTLILKDGVDPAVSDWLLRSLEVSVGGQRSTMGRSTWTAEVVSPPAWSRLPDGRAELVLQSPAILVDTTGGPSTDLAGALSAHPQAGGVQVLPTWIRPTTVYGWNGVAGVARPADRALAAGSVAVLDEEWSDAALADLSRGIGLRRAEGFGEVRFAGLDSGIRGGGHGYEAATERVELPPDPCERLVSLLDSAEQRQLLTRVVAQSRELQTAIDAGQPEGAVLMRVAPIMRFPWARELGPDARTLLEDILRHRGESVVANGSRAAHVAHLTAMLAGG